MLGHQNVTSDQRKHMKIETMVSTGGTSLKEDIMRLYNVVHILVGTPGRILDLANKNVAKLATRVRVLPPPTPG